MNNAFSTMTFIVARPLEKALKLIRTAFQSQDLEVSAELDLSGRLRRELGVSLPECRVLYVDSPLLFLEATVLDRAAAVFFPAHVVVASHGDQTHVHYFNAASLNPDALPVGARVPLAKLQTRVSLALAGIANRQDRFQLIH